MNWLRLKIPPALVFLICAGLMVGIDKWITFELIIFQSPDWLFGFLTMIGGLAALLGVIEFSRKSTTVNPHKPQNTTAFVKSGVYRFTRNPMYLGMLIILCASVVKLENLFAVVIILFFIWYMNVFQIQPEEEMMERKFGDEFREYRKAVRRWI